MPVNRAPDAVVKTVSTCLPVPFGIRIRTRNAAIHEPAAPPKNEATIPFGIQFL